MSASIPSTPAGRNSCLRRLFQTAIAGIVCLMSNEPVLAGVAAPPKTDKATVAASQSVLRVNSTNQPYDFFRPWTKKAPFSRRGLGTLIAGGRILVTAELVANSTFIELEKAATAAKSAATVERVDYECNLAVLRPADPAFLADMKPMELDSGVRVGDRATILQLEHNGEIAQTVGTVTSIVVGGYPMDNLGLLLFRLSAPMQQRDGSFTLPAVRNGRLLGLLMRYDARSQTADIISAPVIEHFLKEVNKAAYGGFARVGLIFTMTRDPQLRRYIGLKEPGGVYLSEVLPGSSAQKAGLKKGDVILAVGGKTIDQDGNYEDEAFGRISFSHLTNTMSFPGDTVPFRIFREGNILEIPVKLESRDPSKVVSESYVVDRAPRFVVLGGIVFMELSRPYLQEWGGDWTKKAPQRLVFYDAFQNELPQDRGKIVFISQILPSPDTIGYEDLDNLVVSKVNNRPIRNLDDLAEAIRHPVDGFQKIELEEDPGILFLDAAAIEKNQDHLIKKYALPALQRL
ncbi:MAG: PDZ domain-containing protein [Chthoniobacterales bacterium]|nr:PDZ domain-containing protein [Chthoniobacterales bacterium]